MPTLCRGLAMLPLPVLHAIGRALGRLIYVLPGRYRQRLQENAAQAGYPGASFARRSAAEAGAMILETCRIWFRNDDSIAQVICDDWDVIDTARAEGKGILFLTPHLGSFEITARYVARRMPLTVMFRTPSKEYLRALMDSARSTSDLTAVPASSQGVRAFMRTLREGGAVGLLPDQAPSLGEGVWVPFFGRQALTMTLPGKLAAQFKVAVILASGERLPRGRGWRLHLMRLPAEMPDNPAAQAALLNDAMETLIRRFPEQYLWSYNRYKTPPGAPPRPAE
ncbi:lysophospholipid acyltransferase family protein [Cupriavidus agavae]|uniref:lysophospholipid acyltransferase family protein n=1 Tax=Cupriavidus agavae TaxID=1001822 RepID=UPI0038B39F77